MGMRRTALALVAAAAVAAAPALGPAPDPRADCVTEGVGEGCAEWHTELDRAGGFNGLTSDSAGHLAAEPVAASPDGTTVVVTRGVEEAGGDAQDWETTAVDTDTGEVRWSRTFSHARYDVPFTVTHTTDGVVLVTGMVDYPDDPNTIYVNLCPPYAEALPATVAYDLATGATLWEHVGERRGATIATTLSADGAVLHTAGTSYTDPPDDSSGSYPCDVDVLVESHDLQTGQRLWSAAHPFPDGSYDRAVTLDATPHGLVLAGSTTESKDRGGQSDAFVMGVSAQDGGLLWRTMVAPGPYTEELRGAVLAADGGTMYVAGHSNNRPGSLFSSNDLGGTLLLTDGDYLVAALDTVTGAIAWRATYRSGPPGPNVANDLALSPDGTKLVVTGQSPGTNDVELDIATVAFDAASGEQRWVHRLGDPGRNVEIGFAVHVAEDDTVLVGAEVATSALGSTGLLLELASDGAQRTTTRLDLDPRRSEDVQRLLHLPMAGRVVLAGPTIDLVAGAGADDRFDLWSIDLTTLSATASAGHG